MCKPNCIELFTRNWRVLSTMVTANGALERYRHTMLKSLFMNASHKIYK